MVSRDIYEKSFDEDVPKPDQNSCPECEGRVTTNVHETICDDCGLVTEEERIDSGPEWREFDDDQTSKRRAGSPNTVARHDRGIGTEIGWDRDSKGRQLDRRKQRQLFRLRREHKRARVGSKAKKNQIAGFGEIRRMTSALGLSKSIRDQACQLYRTAQGADLLQGRSIEAIASACVYAVCRLNEQPRTLRDIAGVSKLQRDRIKHCYDVLNRELYLPVPPVGPKRSSLRLPRRSTPIGRRSDWPASSSKKLRIARWQTVRTPGVPQPGPSTSRGGRRGSPSPRGRSLRQRTSRQ